MEVKARVLFPGEATGDLLRLDAPLSFWGGVEPSTGRVVSSRHPQHGADLTGRVVAVPRTIGSSSSSSVMLELIRNGHGPAALVLGSIDAILVVGCIVGRELGYACPPVYALPEATIAALPAGRLACGRDGVLRYRSR